jgi:hypothetical protein
MENDICLFEHILTQNLLDVALDLYALRARLDVLPGSLSARRKSIEYALDSICTEVKQIIFVEEKINKEVMLHGAIGSANGLTRAFKDLQKCDNWSIFENQIPLCENIQDKLIVCLNAIKKH